MITVTKMFTTNPDSSQTDIESPAVQSRKAGAGHASHYRGEKLIKPARRSGVDPRLVCLVNPRSPTAERYYSLRHAVEMLRAPTHGLVVAVTSPGKGEGKTLTALNLAGALAQDPAVSVLLIDLDIRQRVSPIGSFLDLKPQTGAGLIDWLVSQPQRAEPPVYFLSDFNLYLMQSGGRSDSPYELLNSGALGDLVKQLRLRFDFVIIDAPQAVLLPDISLLARNVDGFLMVIRAGITSNTMLEEALNQIQSDKLLGLVFNDDSMVR